MAKPAYVLLGSNGVVVKVHSTDFGGAAPTAGANDLKTLITNGYQPLREVPLTGGQLLLIMSKP